MIEYVYTLTINGMKCGMCESHINDVIRKNFQVRKVTSNHYKKETVIFSKVPINHEEIKRVINSTGYIFVSLVCEQRQRKTLFEKLFKKK